MAPELRSAGVEYAALRESLSELVRSLTSPELLTPVPACPGWTVHDIVAHLAGVATDVINGVMPTDSMDAWTAAQVQQRRGTATAVVLREWERSSSQLEVLLDRDDSLLPANLLDLAVHDDDVRNAVDRPRRDSSPVHDVLPGLFAQRFVDAVDRAGLETACVVTPHGDLLAGDERADVVLRVASTFLTRAAMGRRSRAQIERCFTGTGHPSAYVDVLCVFAPTDVDVVD